MKNSSRDQHQRSVFQKATTILAYTLATAVAFFATGPAFTMSAPRVRDFVETAYAPELMGIASFGWFIIVALTVFALSVLIVFLLVQTLGLWAGRLANALNFNRKGL